MTETQQRFLRAIAERVPREQVVEVHLFPPIRQGGVETGVAVVAEDPRRPVAAATNGSDPTGGSESLAPQLDSVTEHSLALNGVVAAVDAAEFEMATALAADDTERAEPSDGELAIAEEDDAARVEELPVSEAAPLEDAAPEEAPTDVPGDDALADDETKDASAARARYTIHTARYRLTLKGVDRGKWDFDLVAEADAPLDAVDAVVRGVQRRAGEGADPDRLTTQAFCEALDAPLAQLER